MTYIKKQKNKYLSKYIFSIFFTSGLLLSTNTYSQNTGNNKQLELLETNPNKGVNSIAPTRVLQNIPAIAMYRFDQALKTQNYVSFYDEFAKYNSLPHEQLKYLETKLYDGHAPIYWLVADLHSKLGNDYDTHKWLYVAIIMTKQDSELCSDPSAKNSVNYLLKAFPKAVEITKTTQQNVKPAMNEVIFFLNNLKQRSNPIWACSYGTLKLLPHQIPLVPEQRWDSLRKQVFEDFTKDFTK